MRDDREQIVRVEGPDFCAGIVLRDGICVEAAPVVAWAVGKRWPDLHAAFANKLWRARLVAQEVLDG